MRGRLHPRRAWHSARLSAPPPQAVSHGSNLAAPQCTAVFGLLRADSEGAAGAGRVWLQVRWRQPVVLLRYPPNRPYRGADAAWGPRLHRGACARAAALHLVRRPRPYAVARAPGAWDKEAAPSRASSSPRRWTWWRSGWRTAASCCTTSRRTARCCASCRRAARSRRSPFGPMAPRCSPALARRATSRCGTSRRAGCTP